MILISTCKPMIRFCHAACFAMAAWWGIGVAGVVGQEIPADLARVDLVAQAGEILNPRMAPPVGNVYRMDWVEPSRAGGTGWATVPIRDFSTTRFELRFSVSVDTTVQVSFLGPWQPDAAGNLKPLMVQWDMAETSSGQLDGFRPGEAWHNQPISCELPVRSGEQIALRCVARVPSRFRDDTAWRPAADSPAFGLASQFRRGVNLANVLEVPPGEDWGDNTIRTEDFQQIAAEGFDHVRIPVGWHHHTGPATEYTISNTLRERVDAMLDLAEQNGLGAVVNVHHFDQFHDDPSRQRQKLLSIWKQVASMLRDRPPNVALEILNEPHDRATTEVMNEFYAEVIPAIRAIDPERAIVVGPGIFSQIHELGKLRLPDDERLIVSIHSYTPHFFTHQSAVWAGDTKNIRGVKFPGPPDMPVAIPALLPQYLKDQLEQYNRAPGDENLCSAAYIAAELKVAADWGRYWNRPVWLGEFGAFVEIDAPSRARYCETVRRECERQGMGWCLWDWKATFNYWDRAARAPMPGMREALFAK